MSAQATPSSPKSRRKVILATIVVAIPLIVLLIPPLVYGGFTVPVSRITFGETTGSLSYNQNVQATVEVQTVYEYMFSTRTGGRVRTADTDVSSSRGTANITIHLQLTNPANQTIDLGNVNISGFMGTRNHTIVLGVEEGVRLPGSYHLNILITANVAPVGGLLQLNLTVTIRVDFTVS